MFRCNVNLSDPGQVDVLITDLLSNPILRSRIYERVKFNLNTPNRYFVETLSALEDNFDIVEALRTIHQLETELSFLSHQLVNYDSFINKYDKLSVKVANLKRQNARLLERNRVLLNALSKSKNYR